MPDATPRRRTSPRGPCPDCPGTRDLRADRCMACRDRRRTEARAAVENEPRPCGKCGRSLPPEAFRLRAVSDRKAAGTRRSSQCLDCEHADARGRMRWYVEVLGKPWTNAANQMRHLARRKWFVDPDDLAELVQSHSGRCDLCGRLAKDVHTNQCRLHVDHVHGAGGVRGMLCHHCNTGLGHFREDPELLRRAIAYLAAPPKLPSTLTSSAAAGGPGEQICLG